MKKLVLLVLVISLISAFSIMTAGAQGPSGSYVSGVTCVNLTGDEASIVVQVFDSADSGGASLGSFNDSIGASSNILYFTGSAGDKIGNLVGDNPASVIVSSNKNIACSVNTQTGSGTPRTGTSNGIADAKTAAKIFVPQALRLYSGSDLVFSSYVAVQNTGDTSTVVTAKFFDDSGAEVTTAQQTFTVPAGSAHIFYQDTNTDLGSSFNGSATFESDNGTKLAGTVVMFNDSTTLLTYDAVGAGSASVYAPRFVKNLSDTNLFSGMACQNIGTQATTITADFTMLNQDGNTTFTDTQSKADVDPGTTFGLYAGSLFGTVDRAFGSVEVTATGGDATIACTFNEDARTKGGNALDFSGTGSTYNGIASSQKSMSISFPQVVALGDSSYRGGFQYANTTGTATTCSHTYATKDGVLGTISSVPLAANSANSIFAESDMNASGNTTISDQSTSFNGSVVVTCGEDIVGIYNLAATTLGGDTFTTNTGVNTN